MPIYGAKASQKGFDVRSCADYQLLYSSEWPLFKIEAQGSFTIPDRTANQVIHEHSLGYIPWYMVFVTDGSGSRLISVGDSQFMGINSTELKWQGASRMANAGVLTGYYYIFRYDSSLSFTSTVDVTTTASRTNSGDYGIKVTKPGFDVSSTDYRNFVIHSETRSPMIHKSGTGSLGVGGGTAVIAHGLGYEPMFYAMILLPAWADGYYSLVTNAGDLTVSSTTTDLTLYIVYQTLYRYIILKDPITLN